MKKLLLLLLLPSIGFCDTKISALGSTTTLNPSDIIPVVTNPATAAANKTITFQNLTNAILASSQSWTGSNNWTTPTQSTFTYGLSAGSVTVTGTGNAIIQGTIAPAAGIAASSYTVIWTSMTPTVGNCAVATSTNNTVSWQSCGTGGAGNPAGSSLQLQYNNAGSFGGVSNTIITSTAIIVSTLTVLNNTTTSGNASPGLLDVYSQFPHPVNLATFGSSSNGNILRIPNNGMVDMGRLGSLSGSLVVGDTQGGSGLFGNRIYSNGDNNAFLDFRTLGTSTGTWQTTSGNGPGDIRLQPAGNLMLTLSNQTGITASSGVAIQANGNNIPYLLNIATGSIASGAPYILNVTTSNIINVGAGSAFAYRKTTPGFPMDWACNASDAVDCINVSHSAGVAINAAGTSNNPAIQASNNSSGASASALKVSKIGVSGVASDFETDIATAILANAASGTAIRANSTSGTAIEVDAGNVVLAPLAVNSNICTDGSHNLTTTGCNSGITLSSGVYYGSSVITATSTITSSMTVVLASCTTRGASPNAWITLSLGSANSSVTPETHMIYDVGGDSCTIRIQAAPGDLIESTGTLFLNAQSQHASIQALGNGLWGGGNGGIQYTPWSVFTTQDDVGTFTVAVASQVTSCPIYIPVPSAFMGFRINRQGGNGLMGASIVDSNGKYVTGVSSMNASVGGAVNYLSGGVTQLAPGSYRLFYSIPNTVTSISGSNSVSSNKMYCGTVGTSTTGMDLSGFVPTLPGTTNSGTYPAVDLLFNGGLSSF